MLLLASSRTPANFFFFLLVMLKAFEVLCAVAILDLFEALDVVSQAGVYLLLLSELQLELLDAMLHVEF